MRRANKSLARWHLKERARRCNLLILFRSSLVSLSLSSQIEATNSEAEHLQIVCLSSLLQVGVRVAYLDQSASKEDGAIRTYDFPEGAQPRVHLLYRPGHYDILQAKQ